MKNIRAIAAVIAIILISIPAGADLVVPKVVREFSPRNVIQRVVRAVSPKPKPSTPTSQDDGMGPPKPAPCTPTPTTTCP